MTHNRIPPTLYVALGVSFVSKALREKGKPVMGQQNSIGDLAGVLQNAADVLNRIDQINSRLKDLITERAALLAEVGASWSNRVDDIQKQLQGFVVAVNSAPADPVAPQPEPTPEPAPEPTPAEPVAPQPDPTVSP